VAGSHEFAMHPPKNQIPPQHRQTTYQPENQEKRAGFRGVGVSMLLVVVLKKARLAGRPFFAEDPFNFTPLFQKNEDHDFSNFSMENNRGPQAPCPALAC
jgi:hypothetical protein